MEYKITNVSDVTVKVKWTIPLLNEKDRTDWEEYKLSADFIGQLDEEKIANSKTPMAKRFTNWLSGKALGSMFRETYIVNGIKSVVPAYFFTIKAGEAITLSEERMEQLKYLVRKEIAQNEDTIKRSGGKLKNPQFEGFLTIELVDESEWRGLNRKSLIARALKAKLEHDPEATRDELIKLLESN